MGKKKYDKIYIIGTSGTGKSTLAREISTTKKIPCYDLDDISWEVKYDKKYPKEIRKKKLIELIKNTTWVIEGVYGSWVEPAINKSDLVVWIVLPFHILLWRLLKRHFKRKKKNNESFADLINLINYAFRYKYIDKGETSYEGHFRLLKKTKANYKKIRNNRDIYKLKNQIY